MWNMITKSFKRELIVCFIVVALLPLIISSGFLIQILKTTLSRDYEKRVTGQITEVEHTMVTLFEQFQSTTDIILNDQQITDGITETDSWQKNKIYTELYEETEAIRDVAEIQIYDAEGFCRYSTGSTEENESLPLYWGILKVANAHSDKLIIRNAAEYGTSGKTLLQAARSIRNDKDELLGYIVIDMTEEHFERVLDNSYDSQNSIAVLDSFWEEVYSTRTAKEEAIAENLRLRRMSGESLKQPDDDINFYISPLADTGLYIVIGRAPVFTADTTATMFTVILIMALLSLILCLVLAEKLSNELTQPVKQLSEAMHEVENGNLEQQIETSRKDELGALSGSFNTMTKELKEYMALQVQHQQELNDANIAMMQAQLNPHFLYNTLDTIKWVAKANHVPELATLSASLAKILRTSISEGKFISLAEELQLVECYTNIQEIRFHEAFTFDMEVPIELEECIVPKLIIQPLVENAIIHGLADREDGHVFLNAYEKARILYIEVTDNGSGMDSEIIKQLNSHDHDSLKGHLGFYNVDTIIRLYYGDGYGLHAMLMPEGGTKVTVTLPERREDSYA